jgi:hypothetical protein
MPPLTERQQAAQRLVKELTSLGVEIVSPSEDVKLKIQFPEGAKKRVLQLLRDGEWEFAFIKMVPVFSFAAGNMPLSHVFEILPSQPGVTAPAMENP